VAAVIGLIWRENEQLAASAQTAASDVEALIPQLLTANRPAFSIAHRPPRRRRHPHPPAPIPAARSAALAAPQGT
jgi:hypothetical protein